MYVSKILSFIKIIGIVEISMLELSILSTKESRYLSDVMALEIVQHLYRSKISLDLSKNHTLHLTMWLVVEAVYIKVYLMGGILVA